MARKGRKSKVKPIKLENYPKEGLRCHATLVIHNKRKCHVGAPAYGTSFTTGPSSRPDAGPSSRPRETPSVAPTSTQIIGLAGPRATHVVAPNQHKLLAQEQHQMPHLEEEGVDQRVQQKR
ncbi:hypothetical protein RDI58_018366 [Solanum bulbocastanum]|uniref:Uncharacterized protein n=1 Tax=Solanum bulbocastanum TaxID=147425 RepID=A0AAN8TJF8_SOLBU